MLVVKNLTASAADTRDLDSISGSGRFPGVGNGKPIQYILAWKISSTEEPGELLSTRSQRAKHD